MGTERGHPWYRDGIFAGYPDYRYGKGTSRPVTLAGSKQEKPIFSPGKRKHLIARVVNEIEEWRLSPFEKEGSMTHAMRSHLCLAGERWGQANAEAAFIVRKAIEALGVTRPTWDEGQPRYLDSPDRCTWCGNGVDDPGNGKASRYCSVVCAKSALVARDVIRKTSGDRDYEAAARVLRKSRTTARACEHCGTSFQPIREKSKQRFCSFSCGAKGANRTKPPFALASTSVVMACVYCGGDFETRNRKAIVCSKTCSEAWGKIRKGKEPQRLRPHVFDRYITSRVDPPRLNGARFDFLFWQAGATITAEATMPQPRITDHLFANA